MPFSGLLDKAFMRGMGGHFLQYNLAGWSSLVARKVHILEAVGSNPTPATFFSLFFKLRCHETTKDYTSHCTHDDSQSV